MRCGSRLWSTDWPLTYPIPTNHEKVRTCCCTYSRYKILCCNMPSDNKFLRKRACMHPCFQEHCAECAHTLHVELPSLGPSHNILSNYHMKIAPQLEYQQQPKAEHRRFNRQPHGRMVSWPSNWAMQGGCHRDADARAAARSAGAFPVTPVDGRPPHSPPLPGAPAPPPVRAPPAWPT